MKAVKFDKYGGIDVLNVVEAPKPVPGADEVLVRIKAAGINPGEASIREGKMHQMFPATFPSGEGSDFAGVIESVGDGVKDFEPGDEVIGFTNKRASHAEYVATEATQVVRRPAVVPWEVAGGLFVTGTTAFAAVNAVAVKKGDIVIVSGAAGGVGSIAVQLAKNEGAKVIGIGSEPHHKWLEAQGIVPVAYGDGMKARLEEAAGGQVDAFIDAFGHGYVDLAIQLGVPPARINTIIDFAAAKKYGAKTEGNQAAAKAGVLGKLAAMIADGRLEMPIAKTYPLAQVRDAYKELEQRHTLGKIILIP